jgi:hypothetical protein
VSHENFWLRLGCVHKEYHQWSGQSHGSNGSWLSNTVWSLHEHKHSPLYSWIKTRQLDVTCFIISLCTAQHVLNVSTSIFRSFRITVDLFHVLYCSGSTCVGVMVWFGWGGDVSLCRLKHFSGSVWWNKTTISCKVLKMDVLTLETCWPVNSEIIKQVTSSWSIFI